MPVFDENCNLFCFLWFFSLSDNWNLIISPFFHRGTELTVYCAHRLRAQSFVTTLTLFYVGDKQTSCHSYPTDQIHQYRPGCTIGYTTDPAMHRPQQVRTVVLRVALGRFRIQPWCIVWPRPGAELKKNWGGHYLRVSGGGEMFRFPAAHWNSPPPLSTLAHWNCPPPRSLWTEIWVHGFRRGLTWNLNARNSRGGGKIWVHAIFENEPPTTRKFWPLPYHSVFTTFSLFFTTCVE